MKTANKKSHKKKGQRFDGSDADILQIDGRLHDFRSLQC